MTVDCGASGTEQVSGGAAVISVRNRKRWLAAILAATCAMLPLVASAFTEPRTYYDDPHEGGGGGRWFTGSPAEGHGCSVCHTGSRSAALEIEGLPTGGYVPGKRYDLRLAWPKFAARAETLRARGEGPTSMGLVAEFVADTGEASGSLEIASADDAAAGELCVLPANTPAGQLFGVRPVDQTTEEGTHCEANELGQRCLVAVLSCGAREVRVRWTAPERAQDTIWFAAGFVTTEHARSDAEGDAVAEIAIPIAPADSARQEYEMRLADTCTVSRGAGSLPGDARAWLAIACLTLVGARTWTRSRRVLR